MEMIEINITDPVENWINKIFNYDLKDTIILHEDINDAIWFSTNLIQYLIGKGGCEVIPIYGKLIESLDDFIYQINCCLPIDFKLKNNIDALYDLLLNFVTEPSKRFFIWNDADYLFKNNRITFEIIVEQMLSASFLNRNGLSTIKQNNERYNVQQFNLYIFGSKSFNDLEPIINKTYDMMSIDHMPKGLEIKIDFRIFKLIK